MSQENVELDLNEAFTLYMDGFFLRTGVPGNILYLNQLESIKLDYTPKSIDRADKFLEALRVQIKPDRDDFFNDTKKRNLLFIFTFYICSYMANKYGTTIRWLSYEEAIKHVPDLEQRYEHSILCLMDSQIYAPLDIVARRLFAPNQGMTCREFVDRTVQNFKNKILRFPREVTLEELDAASNAYQAKNSSSTFGLFKKKTEPKQVPNGWVLLAQQCGVATGFGVSIAMGNGNVEPTILHNNMMVDFSMQSDPMGNAFKYLTNNPDRHKQLVFFYGGYINLSVGQRDAIIIEAKNYDGEGLQISMIVPYIKSSGSRPFKLLRPILIDTNIEKIYNPIVFGGFIAGMKLAKHIKWSDYLVEDDCKIFLSENNIE